MSNDAAGQTERGPSLKEILDRACQEPTLLDAISFVSVCDTERAIAQARRNEFKSWETCSKYMISELLKVYPRRRGAMFNINEQVVDNKTSIVYYVVSEPIAQRELDSGMPSYTLSRDPRNPHDTVWSASQLLVESGRFSKLVPS